jgi:hypothetical protein
MSVKAFFHNTKIFPGERQVMMMMSEMFKETVKARILNTTWVPVAHACNPCYSGGRDQEGCSLKPAWANSSQDPISKKTITKKDW